MTLFQKAKYLFEKYERHITTGTLLFGFILDNIAFPRIDSLYGHLLLVAYLVMAGGGILIMNLKEGGVVRHKLFEKIQPFVPALVQFAFGGLFSAFFVFYSRSGSLISSWPFSLFILGLLIGNEFVRNRYSRLVFQVSVFFVTLFSYLIFLLPVVTKKIGTGMFVASSVVSLILMSIFIYILIYFVPSRIKEAWKGISLSVGGIFIFLHVLYFTNLIPPIPLSLKEAGIYHYIEKTGNEYVRVGETPSWFERITRGTVYRMYPKEAAYFWSSVFAPRGIRTNITHEWQYYNESQKIWVTASRVRFAIAGGRDNGYRGYSIKQNLTEGKWRVNIVTDNGRLIGRSVFDVVYEDTKKPLEADIKEL